MFSSNKTYFQSNRWKERSQQAENPDTVEIDAETKAELESAPPVNERMRDLPTKPPKELKPVHLC